MEHCTDGGDGTETARAGRIRLSAIEVAVARQGLELWLSAGGEEAEGERPAAETLLARLEAL